MERSIENLDRLLKMKPGEDMVWTAEAVPVFKTYNGYFGHYLQGDSDDDSWAVDCIKGSSPKVFKPLKMTYAGRFEMPGRLSDYLFIFSAKDGNLRYHGRVMPWYSNRADPFYGAKTASGETFCHLLNGENKLAACDTFFSREECAAWCREMNRNYCFSDAVGSLGKWYEKTLDDMQKQLTECLNADYVVDPVEKLKNIVEGKDEG